MYTENNPSAVGALITGLARERQPSQADWRSSLGETDEDAGAIHPDLAEAQAEKERPWGDCYETGKRRKNERENQVGGKQVSRGIVNILLIIASGPVCPALEPYLFPGYLHPPPIEVETKTPSHAVGNNDTSVELPPPGDKEMSKIPIGQPETQPTQTDEQLLLW